MLDPYVYMCRRRLGQYKIETLRKTDSRYFYFQNETCGSRASLLCSLYALAGCKYSVEVTEKFHYGKIISNTTLCEGHVFKDNFNMQESLDQYDLEEAYYKLYLSLTTVISQ